MTVDQKRLADLLAVARTGSFGRAAAARSVSQPALSVSIALLEKSVGGAVVTRSRSGAVLTPLGEILADHARTLEQLLTRAEAEARLFGTDTRGPLTIGATPVAAASIIPRAILRMTQTVPRLAISVVEGVHDDLVARLATGEMDLVLAPLGGHRADPDIVQTPLLRGPMTVLMRPTHPLARRRTVRFKQLATAEWVLPNPGSALRRRLDALFLLTGTPMPPHTIATNSITTVKSLIRRSDRIAIMSRAMAEAELAAGQLVAVPITDGPFTQTLGIKRWRQRKVSPVMQRFIETLHEVSSEMTAARKRASDDQRRRKNG
jgi:LysR family transcriptional regulator, regulator for genes of the gallate degradation pathway